MGINQLQLPSTQAFTPDVSGTLAGIGETLRKAQADAARQQALSQLGQGGAADTQTLIRSGDPTLLQLGMTMQQRQQEAARQAQVDARQLERDKIGDQHWSQDYGLRARSADRADEDKLTLKEVTDASGATSLVKFNPRTGEVAPVAGPGLTTAGAPPTNPFAAGPKLNQDQSKSATMVDRMNAANQTIEKNKDINSGFFGAIGGAASAIPMVRDSVLFNAVATPERQQVVQAQRNFVNAILRVESGASISQSEFDNAQRQYFPQSGDSKAVIDQKRQNRVIAMQGMAREAGPQYRPPAELINANKPRASQGTSGDAIYAAARDALAKGASREKVLERLQQNGVDPSGL